MRWSISVVMFVVLGVLLLLVGYVAQEQWSEFRALENYEHVRLMRVIGLSGWRLKELFDLELEGLIACATLPGGSPEQIATALDSRLESWRSESGWPGLFESAYLVTGSATAPILEEVTTSGLAAPTASPRLVALVEAVGPLLDEGLPLTGGLGGGRRAVPGIPALLAPTSLQRSPEGALEPAWLAVVLDRTYFRERFLPELTGTFYTEPGFHEVQVAVIESDGGALVFSTLDIDSLEEFGRIDLNYGLLDSGTDGSELPRHGMRPLEGQEAPPNWNDPPTTEDHLRFKGFWARLFYSGHWQIYIRRDGVSVGDAAFKAHQHSLLATLGVLAVLCVAIALIVIFARRLQRLADEKLQFVASVSHELRTPLAVLGVAGENLTDDLVTDPARVRVYGDVIQRETRRLRWMIDNVLHLARRRAGTPVGESVSVDLDRLVREELEARRDEFEAADFEVEYMADAPADVVGDPRALGSAFRNLVTNALKYARDGRWLGVRLQRAEGGAPEVQLIVEDRGLGVDDAELASIWKPFSRGHRAMEAGVEGSGLGLAVVEDVVRSHGGRVAYEDRAEGGARFTLHLPAESAS